MLQLIFAKIANTRLGSVLYSANHFVGGGSSWANNNILYCFLLKLFSRLSMRMIILTFVQIVIVAFDDHMHKTFLNEIASSSMGK
jgi:hypothetical protein